MNLNNISTEIIQRITTQQAWHYMILPYQQENDTLYCVIADDTYAPSLEEELEVLLGYPVLLQTIDKEVIREKIGQYYRKSSEPKNKETTPFDADIKNAKSTLNNLIQEALEIRSSDIHFEPYENEFRIRFRIDGRLIERYFFTKENYPSLVNIIKIQAKLDISEKRLPQDGRIVIKEVDSQKQDIRVSILPTLHGEKIVLRLLNNDISNIDLNQLGFTSSDLENYKEGIKNTYGIILISGPTGSGKTTTLYSTLQLINETSRNIVTIEDPIEYTLAGINQVQLKESIGLDFPKALRTFLRQDPDVIMVGEIRDKDTAEMAIRASLTGHLVFSTIHTNSAWSIVARLIDMGIPSFLIADTLNMAVAQRLVRELCTQCKQKKAFEKRELPKRYIPSKNLSFTYHATGCENCFYTGYKNRIAIYEVIPIDNELRDKIKDKILNVDKILSEKGITSLHENAFALVEQGITSIKEVYPILATA